jgi:hypothetical protein
MLALAIECPVAIYSWTGSTGGVLPIPTPLTLLRGDYIGSLSNYNRELA